MCINPLKRDELKSAIAKQLPVLKSHEKKLCLAESPNLLYNKLAKIQTL